MRLRAWWRHFFRSIFGGATTYVLDCDEEEDQGTVDFWSGEWWDYDSDDADMFFDSENDDIYYSPAYSWMLCNIWHHYES